jgi:hypothetical protein
MLVLLPKKPKRKRADNTIWSTAEAAELVAVLLTQKVTGNASDNGFKTSVWTMVKDAIAVLDLTEKQGPLKEQKQCKAK